jgi:hypothetical protein
MFQEDTGSVMLAKQKALRPMPALVDISVEKRIQGKP